MKRLSRARLRLSLAIAGAAALLSPPARAALGEDLTRLRQGLAEQTRSGSLGFRLVERGDVVPLVLPPWAMDAKEGDCTTVVLVAPPPTQFLLHVHPWPGLPSVLAASAGALQITRCGPERVTLLEVRLELRSPRAVVHGLVSVGAEAPPPLTRVLPERDAGGAAPLGDAGPEPRREPLSARLARFEATATSAGASAVESPLLPSPGYVRLTLAPGCHRLLATGAEGAPHFTLLLGEGDDASPERWPANEQGDVGYEVCTVKSRKLTVSVEGEPTEAERRLGVAHFPLPRGLPGRFGPVVAERLLQALGKSLAPARLGTLVSTTLGAQGRTPLPRALLPQTCYLAALAVVHGQAQTVTLAARTGPASVESTSREPEPSARVTFCTGRSGNADVEVEARGLGVAWQFFLFQMGPARPEAG